MAQLNSIPSKSFQHQSLYCLVNQKIICCMCGMKCGVYLLIE